MTASLVGAILDLFVMLSVTAFVVNFFKALIAVLRSAVSHRPPPGEARGEPDAGCAPVSWRYALLAALKMGGIVFAAFLLAYTVYSLATGR